MPEFFETFFTSEGFIPHGHCYLWKSELVWLHVVSDSLIALAYYSIPIMLVYFVRKRRDVPFDWIFLMFGTFIVACGTTHVFEVWTLWHPTYWLSGFIKAITAVASLCTAVLLVLLIPKALGLPSPAQLEAINIALRNEITQRKLAESALRESEERLQAFLNNAPAVIYLKDTEGRFSLVNREFENLFHVSKEQIVGKSDYELFPVPMAEAFRASDQRALEAETPLQLEEVVPQDDGLHTYISIKFPLYNSSGVPYGIGGISTDITERKLIEEALQRANEQLEIRVQQRTIELALINESLQAEIAERKRGEEALRRSQQRLSAIFNQAAVGIAQVGMDGQYLLVNQKLCDILGYTREELLEQTFQDLMHPDDQEANLKYSRQILSSEVSVVSREKCYICKDGSSIWINLTVSLIRDSSGEPKTFIGIVEDISDRKRVEQQIRELNENLERRVIERTAELETANKELEAFSYSVSHDLRAPLRGVDGFSQALLDCCADKLDDKGKHYLQRIRGCSQRMSELIDDLIKLSRVTRSEMHRTNVDLSALAQEIAIELQQTQPERQVEWTIAPEIVAQGDARLLRVVLENLFNNAWKFTSARTQTCIEFGFTLQADDKVAYFVRDNGAGFDMAYANKLFGAFQRLHSTTQFPGTGIGLATVQRIIHRHGGRVWAEGLVEQGATFCFTL